MDEKAIVLASDHNGVELKKHLYDYLKEKGYNCIDLGPFTEKFSVDYTDYAFQLGQIIQNKDVGKGILICGTGVGMSVVANKFQDVRAALIHNLESAPKSREHNDSNVICLGAWLTPPKRAEEIIDVWLNTPFGEGRHVKRVEKISNHHPNTIVFTNGIFDILHMGHIGLLKFSKSLGDKLIVGINSDRATKTIKGEDRPVNNEEDRKKVLESVQEVDEVIIFDDTETKDIISKVKPTIVVKGGEWTAEEVRKRDEIPSEIGIKIFPLVKNYSTTEILKKIDLRK
ncbi:MAG: ribose 5-phosphate isomerase B [Candidatus Woesearchaeota archaeon]